MSVTELLDDLDQGTFLSGFQFFTWRWESASASLPRATMGAEVPTGSGNFGNNNRNESFLLILFECEDTAHREALRSRGCAHFLLVLSRVDPLTFLGRCVLVLGTLQIHCLFLYSPRWGACARGIGPAFIHVRTEAQRIELARTKGRVEPRSPVPASKPELCR